MLASIYRLGILKKDKYDYMRIHLTKSDTKYFVVIQNYVGNVYRILRVFCL